MDTLPVHLAPGLRLLSVGINPSLRAVRAGFYFPNPRNRFWPALNASGLLAALIAACRPSLLWFHGATAYRAFCRLALTPPGPIALGLQAQRFAGARIFVSPNPTPANARYSLAQITASYRRLATCLAPPASAPDDAGA